MPDTTPVYGLPYPNNADQLKAAVKDIPKSLALQLESTIAGFGGIAAPGVWNTVGAAGQPAFVAGWAAYGAGFQVPQFRKVGNRVDVRGVLSRTGATAGEWGIFQLPGGFRPAAKNVFATLANNVLMRVDVAADGTVSTVLSVATGVYVSLGGISFYTD